MDKGKQCPFFETKILSTPINSGVCVNYALLINSIHTEFFIQIAGDDLVCSRNVLESMSNLGQNEIRVHLPVIYNGRQVRISDANIARQLFYMNCKHTNKRDIRILETLTPYCSVEIAFLKRHYTLDSMEFIKQYRNFEDDTSLYYIMKNNKKTMFTFSMEPFLIYRKAGDSLTTSVDNASQMRFLDDLYSFRKLTLKKEKHIPTKLFLVLCVWHGFLMKHRFDASKSLYKKSKDFIEKKTIEIGKKNPHLTEYREKINLFLQGEEQYLRQMETNSKAFLEDVRKEFGNV